MRGQDQGRVLTEFPSVLAEKARRYGRGRHVCNVRIRLLIFKKKKKKKIKFKIENEKEKGRKRKKEGEWVDIEIIKNNICTIYSLID